MLPPAKPSKLSKSQPNDESPAANDYKSLDEKLSSNLFKLVSRNLILVFAKIPNKIYDFTNGLLNHLYVNDWGQFPPIAKLSTLLLIDLFETYPNSLNSLINFSVNQIYKILKKYPGINSNLLFLLNSITKNALKSDIDDKFQQKLIKLLTKNILTLPITYDLPSDSAPIDNDSQSTVLLKRNYISSLKNVLILSLQTSYEHLLEFSTSSSGGSKLKPEAIMAQQHQFQTTLLTTNEKVINYCLSNANQEVRIAAVELLSQVLMNFVPTGKFDPVEYLINLYCLPNPNCWDESLSATIGADDSLTIEIRKEKNLLVSHDSESIINSDTALLLFQTSVVETLIIYIQLQQFQYSDFFSNNLTTILDAVLNKFAELNTIPNHFQNQQWNKCLKQWLLFVDFLVKESGSNCHEILSEYIYLKFLNGTSTANSGASESTPRSSISKPRKRDSTILGFKSAKSSSSSKTKSKDGNSKSILPFVNPYQTSLLLHIAELLIPFGTNIDSSNKEDDNSRVIEEESDQENSVVDEEESQSRRDGSFISDLLLKLLVNKNEYIRNYSLKTLLWYASVNEVEINQIILKVFDLVNGEYSNSHLDSETELPPQSDENISTLPAVKLMSYSLALSSLIKQTNITSLQTATIMKVLSFCTQNLKHNTSNSHTSYLKNSSCWVILSSLVTFYNESEYIKLNSSQFLVFWKNLLTSQFISTSVSGAGHDTQKREILDNLKLRNFSLVCLLNYLKTVDLSPESLKQVQFLLTKSFNYLTYLENNIEGVGAITNFNGDYFNENDFNSNMTNNLAYSNYTGNKKLPFARSLISLIFYAKKIIIESFSKLATVLKNDVNSHMVIFLLKIFSDSKSFSRIRSLDFKDLAKSAKNKINSVKLNDNDNSNVLLGEDYNYSFGVTSKFQAFTANIDELLIKFNGDKTGVSKESQLFYKDTFMPNYVTYPNGSIERSLDGSYDRWFDVFENIIMESVDHDINYDPTVYLLEPYSLNHTFSASLLTTLVDQSIELFQLVFPYLSLKIQFSLLEQIRNSLSAKDIDPLRYKAVLVNVSVAIHGLLNYLVKREGSLNMELVNVIVDILDKFETENPHLLSLNADSLGLVTSLCPKAVAIDSISKYINLIINDTNPYKRGWHVLILGKIYEHAHVGFNDIYNVVSQLLKDPHPIVYYFSLKAAALILENNLSNHHLIASVLDTLYDNYLNDSFSYNVSNKVFVNLKVKFGSIGLVTSLLKLSVTALGPNLRDWPAASKSKLKQLIISLSFGIGCETIDDYLETFGNLLRLLEELIIFDPDLLDGEVTFFTDLLNLIISKNIKTGLLVPYPTSINRDSIFPFNTSFELYKSAYGCYVELIKIFGVLMLNKETVKLLWISMDLKPCQPLKDLIELWLDLSLDMNWFVQLSALFKISSKKLVGPFIDVNYLQKLLPLQQRLKKSSSKNIDFKDEEVENIVGDSEDIGDKNEPITWEFKLFIYHLLDRLFEEASKNGQLVEQLKPKIQEIVKISFFGSTAPIGVIKLRGANILDKALGLFGHMADPLYPGVSILEQQQAQIISALIPCFSADSDSEVIVNAINVGSKFINLPRIKFYSKQRILKTLIYLLEEISSNKFLKFGFLEHMSEYGKKSIQLAILNCWALLKIDSEESDTEVELQETLSKYSTLLTSLWILVLRELSSLKYNETSTKELELYGNYWVNFVTVLSLQLEKDDAYIREYLGDDESSFFFILFSQCVESLIRNKNVLEILVCVKSLVQNSELVEILFNDEIFGEVIDLFDRLILIDDDTEVKCNVLEIINSIFHTFLNGHKGDLTNSFDKLFELIRVTMSPMFSILPFLKSDFDPNNPSHQLLLKHCDSAPNLLILKTVFSNFVDMINKFPDVVKVDLYSCILFIFAKFYEFKNELLIAIILPHLKQIIQDSKKFDGGLVSQFYNIIRQYYTVTSSNNYSVLTTMILITSGDIQINKEDSETLSRELVLMLSKNESAATGIQCIKSLINYSSLQSKDILVVKELISKIIVLLAKNEETDIDIKVLFEILLLFAKSKTLDDAKLTALYSLIIPLLLSYNGSRDKELGSTYLHEKLLLLIGQHPTVFKAVINQSLTNSQRLETEALVKLNQNQTQNSENGDAAEPEIQLKTFGEH